MEALIEIFAEVFAEVFCELIVCLLSNCSGRINCDSKTKKIIKYTIGTLVFSGCLVLFILSLIYKTAIYVRIVIIYFIILLVFYILRFIFKNNNKNSKLNNSITWSIRVVHYVFPVVLIIFASINKNAGSNYLIVFSSIALFIYLCINIYRIRNYLEIGKCSYSKFVKRSNKFIKLIEKRKNGKSRQKAINLYLKNKNHFIRYINECDINQFKIILKDVVLLDERLICEKALYDEIKNASSKFLDIEINELIKSLDKIYKVGYGFYNKLAFEVRRP